MVPGSLPIKQNKRTFGTWGEDKACRYLEKEGYRIVMRNYRVGRLGEVDIVAREGEYLCFVEVKTRTGTAYGNPCEAVGFRKQQSIRMLAAMYLGNKGLADVNVRFDVVEILCSVKKSAEPVLTSVRLLRNAF